MISINDSEEVSSERKEKIFELEEQNIENIKKTIKQNNPIRKNCKNAWTTYEYCSNNCIIYKLTNKEDTDNSTIIVTNNILKGLSWKDLINIQNNNELETNIEQGAWITYYKDKIRYTISYNKEVIVSIQIEKKENEIVILGIAKTEELEKNIRENLINEILLIDILKNITYDSNDINKFIEELNKYCITVSRTEIEKQLLILEKKELQENVNILVKKVNNATKQIEELTKYASIAEEKTKRTIEEIDRVKNENDNLKNSIFNVRKSVLKRCAYIPIIGRLIAKDFNKEFGENALPSGK